LGLSPAMSMIGIVIFTTMWLSLHIVINRNLEMDILVQELHFFAKEISEINRDIMLHHEKILNYHQLLDFELSC